MDLTYIDQMLEAQRAHFLSGATRSYSFRVEQLRKLKRAIEANEAKVLAALESDMKKPPYEAFVGEVAFLYWDIDHTIKHLKGWMKPRRVKTPLTLMPSSSRILSEPLGQVLIISPWNYPFQLLLAPLVGAMAAGNVAVLKPSELAPATSRVVADLIAATFPPELVAVVEGGVEASQALLARKFDHIFFTGGAGVGKIVAKAAAEHLTPVTLELGGKSPCIVTPDADLAVAARRIAWGKFFNAGQTCVAPDYLLVHRSVKEPLLAAMERCLTEFYGADPKASADLARIISLRHFDRLAGLLGSGKVRIGGQVDREQRYIAPTVVDEVGVEDPVMQEEVFGPILPVLTYESLDEAIGVVRRMPNPLALYLFTNDRATEARVMQDLPFGGGCVNNTLVHLSNPDLPFGGVGSSGIGAYHGKTGFDTFAHQKSVMRTSTRIDPNLRYQPYSGKLALIKRLMPWL